MGWSAAKPEATAPAASNTQESGTGAEKAATFDNRRRKRLEQLQAPVPSPFDDGESQPAGGSSSAAFEDEPMTLHQITSTVRLQRCDQGFPK